MKVYEFGQVGICVLKHHVSRMRVLGFIQRQACLLLSKGEIPCAPEEPAPTPERGVGASLRFRMPYP